MLARLDKYAEIKNLIVSWQIT